MDFKYPPEAEKFRQEIRAWLEVNAPKHEHPPYDMITVANDEEWEERKAWYRKLHSGGWIGISWPRAYGGRDADVMEAVVFHEELARFHAHLPYIGAGVALVGPTLIQWGTEAQKTHFIPRILSGEDTWCQGYSEPNAGSDLTAAANQGQPRRRLLRRQRLQDLDLPGPSGGLDVPAVPHRPQAARQPRPVLYPGRHENARYHHPPDGRDQRPGQLQPGVLRQRAGAQGKHRRQDQRGLARRDHDAGLTSAISADGSIRTWSKTWRGWPRKFQLNGRPAWENDAVRQKIAAFACEAEALKYTAFRGITRRLKGQSPGPESSTVKRQRHRTQSPDPDVRDRTARTLFAA